MGYVCHCFAAAVRRSVSPSGTASAKQWHTEYLYLEPPAEEARYDPA